MMRVFWVSLLTCLAMVAPVQAAMPSGIYLAMDGEWDGQKIEKVLRASLTDASPDIKLLMAAGPDALYITVPAGVTRHNSDAGDNYTFTAIFSYRGNKLGESFLDCPSATPKICGDQLAADALSAVLAVSH